MTQFVTLNMLVEAAEKISLPTDGVSTFSGATSIRPEQLLELDKIYHGATQPAYEQIVEQVRALGLVAEPQPADNLPEPPEDGEPHA